MGSRQDRQDQQSLDPRSRRQTPQGDQHRTGLRHDARGLIAFLVLLLLLLAILVLTLAAWLRGDL